MQILIMQNGLKNITNQEDGNLFENLNASYVKRWKTSKNNFKVVTAIFGILFLTGGVIAGTMLVLNPGLFTQKAQTTSYIPTCTQEQVNDYLTCNHYYKIIGSTTCVHPDYDINIYCCSEGYIAGDNSCYKMPTCDSSYIDCRTQEDRASSYICSVDGTSTGTRYCCRSGQVSFWNRCIKICDPTLSCGTNTTVGTNSTCAPSTISSLDDVKFCCPKGQLIVNGICTPICKSGVICSQSKLESGIRCLDTSSGPGQVKYCCQTATDVIVNGMCQAPNNIPACEAGAKCGYTYVSQSSYCLKSTSSGGSYAQYCCPKDNFYSSTGCKPIPCSPTYPCTGTKPAASPLPKSTTKPGY